MPLKVIAVLMPFAPYPKRLWRWCSSASGTCNSGRPVGPWSVRATRDFTGGGAGIPVACRSRSIASSPDLPKQLLGRISHDDSTRTGHIPRTWSLFLGRWDSSLSPGMPCSGTSWTPCPGSFRPRPLAHPPAGSETPAGTRGQSLSQPASFTETCHAFNSLPE